jgi:hypothetical protein
MPSISINSWNRFRVSNLFAVTEVMGAVHEFTYENHLVVVRLPSKENAHCDKDFGNLARPIRNPLKISEILMYEIAEVDVEITLPDSIIVPEEALSKPPNQYEHFDKKQKKAIEDVCGKLSRIAYSVFNYWLEIIRWVSSYAMIGQPDFGSINSGFATYLIDSSSKHRVWNCSDLVTGFFRDPVTVEHWTVAEKHLKNSDEVPLHIRFFYDARVLSIYGQYNRAIIYLAMSCEVYLRYKVFELIPDSTPEELSKYIEEANISRYLNHFFKSLVQDSHTKKYNRIQKDIFALMAIRNSYLHLGKLQKVDYDLCMRFRNATKELFNIPLK